MYLYENILMLVQYRTLLEIVYFRSLSLTQFKKGSINVSTVLRIIENNREVLLE